MWTFSSEYNTGNCRQRQSVGDYNPVGWKIILSNKDCKENNFFYYYFASRKFIMKINARVKKILIMYWFLIENSLRKF